MVHVQLNRLEQDSQDLETYAHRLIEKGKETQAKLILKKKAFIDKTIETYQLQPN
jgi:phage shock protein A|tara:strand:+ start:1902 stop:2066 length:165 start_codon:yes stop_codon:yes gene_type:complete